MNQSATANSESSRQFLRFRLVTLLLVIIPVAFTSLWIGELLDKRPIEWIAFSKSVLKDHVKHNQPVLVYFGAEWDLNSKFVETNSFETRRIRRIINSRGIIAMKADVTEWTQETLDILNSIDEHSTPVVAIYTTKPNSQPIVLSGLFSEPELFDAIVAATDGC